MRESKMVKEKKKRNKKKEEGERRRKVHLVWRDTEGACMHMGS